MFASRAEPDPETSMSFAEQRHEHDLAEVLKAVKPDRFFSRRAGDGLVLVAYRLRKQALYSTVVRATAEVDGTKMDGFVADVAKIILPESPHNGLQIDGLFYSRDGEPKHLLGTMPLFWWNVDSEMIRRLIFQEIVVLSVFNPAHFVAKLQRKGFDVSVSPKSRELIVSKKADGAVCHMHGMTYYTQLVSKALFAEDFVVRVLEQFNDTAASHGKANGPGKMKLVLNALWHPPRNSARQHAN